PILVFQGISQSPQIGLRLTLLILGPENPLTVPASTALLVPVFTSSPGVTCPGKSVRVAANVVGALVVPIVSVEPLPTWNVVPVCTLLNSPTFSSDVLLIVIVPAVSFNVKVLHATVEPKKRVI